MKLTKDFYTLPKTREEVYEYTAEIEGKLFRAQYAAMDRTLGGPPLQYIERRLRADLMQAIEDQLFKGHA